jgi:hypothetical protein
VNGEEIYNAWKEQKNQIELSQDFSRAVMDRVYQYEQGKGRTLLKPYQLIELISAHPFVKAAVVTAGAAAGLARIMFLAYAFLGC